MTTTPNVAVKLEQFEPQPVLSIRETVQIKALGEAVGEMLGALSAFLKRRGVRPAGPPFVRYHVFGDTETDMELGVPVTEPVAGKGRVAGGELPGGPAIAPWHLGAHDRLGEAYARLQAWLTGHGRTPSGAAWEVYFWIDAGQDGGPKTSPDASSWRTQLVQPITEA